MAQAADIKDEWSLSLWLSGQNDFVPLQIASRASLRLLPIWTSFAETPEAKNRNIELLPVLRGFLATSISPSFSEMENEKLLSRVAPYAERARVNLDNIQSIKDISAEIDLTSISRYHFRDVASASLSVLATRTGRRTKREEQLAHEMARGSIAYAASVGLLPDAGPVEISIDAESHEYWQSVLSDADAAETRIYLKDIPLWPVETPLLRLWEKTRQDWSQPNSPYAFWLRWYDSLLDPKATPPFADDLLYRIALIDDAIWKAGAEAVADEIARIEEQFDLLEQVRSAKAELAAIRSGRASRALRADNLPEGMEPLADLDAGINDAIAGLDDAQQELEKPKPSRQSLKKAAAAIGRAAKVLAVYLGKKADKVIDILLEEGTKELVKKGSLILSLGLIERLFHISEAIAKFANKLPWP